MTTHKIKSDKLKTSETPLKGVRPPHSSDEAPVMGVERRGRQSSNLIPNFHSINIGGTSGQRLWKGEPFLNRWMRIALRAQRHPTSAFNNLLLHINEETLKEAYNELDGTKALGVDGISKSEYGKCLQQNLKGLTERLRKGSYRPQPKREVLIPKASGKYRPIAVACFEDKLVDAVVAKILNSVYDSSFIPTSYGFRPRKSANQAIEFGHKMLRREYYPFVVEMDFSNFFNEIPHNKLMETLEEKISDEKLLRLIGKFLKGKTVKQGGQIVRDSCGTPQGGLMSPILANVYLDKALDKWFTTNQRAGAIVRYADDAVFFFSRREKAESLLANLKKRVESFGLKVNEEKSRFLSFRRTENTQFSFLGFTFYWGIQNKRRILKVKTEKKKLHKAMNDFYHWIKTNRSRRKLSELWELANAKLRGHYNYFGYRTNRQKLVQYYHEAVKAMFKWLNRRGQKRSYNWDGFKELLRQNPLVTPPKTSDLKRLGWSFGDV